MVFFFLMVNDKDNVIILNARKLMRIFSFFTKKCLILCMSWSVVVIELEYNTLMTEDTERIIKIREHLLVGIGWQRSSTIFRKQTLKICTFFMPKRNISDIPCSTSVG